jgi:hypothetical protein
MNYFGYLIVISVRTAATKKKSTDVARELKKAFEALDILEADTSSATEDKGITE